MLLLHVCVLLALDGSPALHERPGWLHCVFLGGTRSLAASYKETGQLQMLSKRAYLACSTLKAHQQAPVETVPDSCTNPNGSTIAAIRSRQHTAEYIAFVVTVSAAEYHVRAPSLAGPRRQHMRVARQLLQSPERVRSGENWFKHFVKNI